MKRLTRWNDKTECAELTSYDDYDWKQFWNKELLDDVDFLKLQPAFDKLAEYEDAEENGELLRLPCTKDELINVLAEKLLHTEFGACYMCADPIKGCISINESFNIAGCNGICKMPNDFTAEALIKKVVKELEYFKYKDDIELIL